MAIFREGDPKGAVALGDDGNRRRLPHGGKIAGIDSRVAISVDPYLTPKFHVTQQWFGYSDPAMEEAWDDVPLLREFAGLDAFEDVSSCKNVKQ